MHTLQTLATFYTYIILKASYIKYKTWCYRQIIFGHHLLPFTNDLFILKPLFGDTESDIIILICAIYNVWGGPLSASSHRMLLHINCLSKKNIFSFWFCLHLPALYQFVTSHRICRHLVVSIVTSNISLQSLMGIPWEHTTSKGTFEHCRFIAQQSCMVRPECINAMFWGGLR